MAASRKAEQSRRADQSRLSLGGGGGPRAPGADESLHGLVERVTYQSEESGFCVLQVKCRSRRDLQTVVGRAPTVRAGEWVEAEGRWRRDPVHGLQFQAQELRTTAPTTREGMRRYLASGLVRGIGPALAKRLIEAFGERVFEVIAAEPERLREVRGVGAVRAERMHAAWRVQERVREIMVFLHSHGVGTARAVRIHKTYGDVAIELIREDPYRLARDIRGVGFVTADALARSLGVAPDALARVRGGVRHTLAEALSDGHCGLPEGELEQRCVKLLGVDRERVREAVAAELAEAELVRADAAGRSCLFLPGLFGAERAAAARLRALAAGDPPWGSIDVERAIPWLERRLDLVLAPSQRAALTTLFSAKLGVLTGGPGVGKTTLVRALLEALCAKGVRVALAAPTGRAAKRLGEATGVPARTIHRLLEVDARTGGFKRGEGHPLNCDLLVVDEVSMVDVLLFHALVRALPRHAALFLIGDVDQLPSVGPGKVLADLIESGALPVVRLREVFRQAAASHIVRAAHAIREGRSPELAPEEGSDFYFVEIAEPERAAERLLEMVCERIPRRFGLDPLREVQVLCPMQRGRLGARTLNAELQARLNPQHAGPAVERFGQRFAVGDKLMQVQNDYEKDVFNGDIGFVRTIDPDQGVLRLAFDGSPPRCVDYDFGELDALSLAYAMTVHKAQGSEYPAVVMPLSTQHYPMLQRRLLYTGVTRGRKLVVLLGERRALAIAVRAHGHLQRCSKLGEWLAESAVQPPSPFASIERGS